MFASWPNPFSSSFFVDTDSFQDLKEDEGFHSSLSQHGYQVLWGMDNLKGKFPRKINIY